MPGIYRNPWTDEETVNGYEEDTSDFLELVYHPNMVLFFLTCLRLAAALRNLLMSIYKDYQKAKADSCLDVTCHVCPSRISCDHFTNKNPAVHWSTTVGGMNAASNR